MKSNLFAFSLMAGSIAASATLSGQPGRPPLPNPDANGIYHGGKDVIVPTILEQPQWKPPLTGKYATQLSCIVGFTVTSDGITSSIEVKRCIVPGHKLGESKEFDTFSETVTRSAFENVELIRFHPARYKGAPVPFRMFLEMNTDSISAR